MSKRSSSFAQFAGGLVTEIPAIMARPGTLRSSQNVYQGVTGGYHTVSGCERFDGRPKPSAALYSVLPSNITGALSVGDTVTDNTAAASGVVIAVLPTYLVLTKNVGTFAVGTIRIGGVPVGTCSSAQVIGGASTALLGAQYTNLAADNYRADITAVPGSGGIIGIAYLAGIAYAFRNNAGGTAAAMFKSSTSGWTSVNLGRELNFTSGGAYQIQDGDTIVGAISGATAVVGRVALQSGSWSGGTAVGKMVFQSQTGVFEAENLDVGASLNVCSIAGNSSAITLAANGNMETINASFTGSSASLKIYGCDGVNRAFEFDGTNYVPLDTGMTIFPTHIIEHKYHLFLSFASSAQHSAIGDPYQWTLLTGADELALSDSITGFVTQPSSETSATLAILTRNSIGMLYGTSSADWNLQLYKRDAGAIEWSVQFIGSTFMLDDRGIVRLSTSQLYGNFADAADSQEFSSWLLTKKTQVTSSFVSVDRNLYGIFFNDNSGIFCTIDNGKMVAACPVLLDHRVLRTISREDNSGNEVILFGDNDGMVHQLFSGTSFDGNKINWFFDTSYDFLKAPLIDKRYERATIEVAGAGYNTFYFSYTIGYGDTSIAQSSAMDARNIELSPGTWDVGVWDVGVWDGKSLSPSYYRMMGIGENITFRLSGNIDYGGPLKFSGILLQYVLLREKRST